MRAPQRAKAGKLAGKRTNRREAAVLTFAKQCQTCLWDFASDGGAVGDISFGVKLPANAVVTDVYSDEQTAVTAATSITLKAGSTSLTGAIDFTASSGVGAQALASSATAIKLSAESELKITIATTAATAGKVRFAVEYYISE
jgi:hypothetical protein